MSARTWIPLLGAVAIAAGCGTYRTGYFSMPYVGDVPPGAEAAKLGAFDHWDRLRYLSVRELTVYVNLMNDVDTSNAPWVGIGERRVARMRHCILLRLYPVIDRLSLEPKLVSMSINGIPHAVMAAERYLGTGSQSEIVTEGRIPLAHGEWNSFGLCFAEAAAPDQDIAIDLRRALLHPGGAPFPLIKFKMQSYRRLYS